MTITISKRYSASAAAPGLPPLLAAAGTGRADLVSRLLAEGADPRTVDSRAGATALHKACQRGSLECVRLLIEAGALIDAQCVSTGHTALVEAIWFKHVDVVEYLLDRGAGLGIETHYGFALDQHINYAKSVNQSIAAEEAKVLACADAVERRREADRTLVSEQGLMKAVQDGEVDSVRRLLAEGATVDARYPILNGFDDAHTPLLVACRDGHTEIVGLLVAGGADVNAVEPTFGAVPLHKAVYNGHVEITQILVEQPGIDLDFQGSTNGYTPLLDAIWHGFERCCQILLDAGARRDVVGHDGKTPLALAVEVFGKDHSIVAQLAD